MLPHIGRARSVVALGRLYSGSPPVPLHVRFREPPAPRTGLARAVSATSATTTRNVRSPFRQRRLGTPSRIGSSHDMARDAHPPAAAVPHPTHDAGQNCEICGSRFADTASCEPLRSTVTCSSSPSRLGGSCPGSGTISGKTTADIGKHLANFGSSLSACGQLRLALTEIGQCFAPCGQMLPRSFALRALVHIPGRRFTATFGQLRSSTGSSRVTFRDVWRASLPQLWGHITRSAMAVIYRAADITTQAHL